MNFVKLKILAQTEEPSRKKWNCWFLQWFYSLCPHTFLCLFFHYRQCNLVPQSRERKAAVMSLAHGRLERESRPVTILCQKLYSLSSTQCGALRVFYERQTPRHLQIHTKAIFVLLIITNQAL